MATATKTKKAPVAKATAGGFADKTGYLLAIGDQVRFEHASSKHSGRHGILTAIHPRESQDIGPVATVEFLYDPHWQASPAMPAFEENLTFVSRERFAVGERARVAWNDTKLRPEAQAYTGREGRVASVLGNTPFPDIIKLEFGDATVEDRDFQATDLLRTAMAEHPAIQEESDLPFLNEAPAATPEPLYTPTKMKLVLLTDIIVTSNTRKVFDEVALGELAESIKTQGVIAPITVRPHGTEAGKFELVAGERRYRASKLAEQQTIPAVIRTLTDREFLEVQLLENLQRVDVRPADEAQAFAKLIANGYSAEEIGLKVGKGEKFVLQRAKLAELTEFWLDLLLQERLPLVAAHQVARLPVAAQEIVQRHIEKEWGYQLKNGGVFEAERIARIISEQVLRELSRAPFPLDDAKLYPKAGACLTCPKRSCAVPRLFDEPERTGSDLCLDGACYAEKKVRFVARQIKDLTAQLGKAPALISLSYYTENKQAITKDKYTEAQPGADGAFQAVVIEGPEAGTIRWVIIKNAVANHEQKKADRSAELRAAKINEANRALLTRHLYTQALGGRVLEQQIEQELMGQLRSQGGPHTPLRLALVNDFGWGLPEGGEAALRKLTAASNYQGLWAWVKQNVDRLNYEQKLALYFAMLGYNCSTFDSGNKRLSEYAKLAGANTTELLKLATESVTPTKGKKQEATA